MADLGAHLYAGDCAYFFSVVILARRLVAQRSFARLTDTPQKGTYLHPKLYFNPKFSRTPQPMVHFHCPYQPCLASLPLRYRQNSTLSLELRTNPLPGMHVQVGTSSQYRSWIFTTLQATAYQVALFAKQAPPTILCRQTGHNR